MRVRAHLMQLKKFSTISKNYCGKPRFLMWKTTGFGVEKPVENLWKTFRGKKARKFKGSVEKVWKKHGENCQSEQYITRESTVPTAAKVSGMGFPPIPKVQGGALRRPLAILSAHALSVRSSANGRGVTKLERVPALLAGTLSQSGWVIFAASRDPLFILRRMLIFCKYFILYSANINRGAPLDGLALDCATFLGYLPRPLAVCCAPIRDRRISNGID